MNGNYVPLNAVDNVWVPTWNGGYWQEQNVDISWSNINSFWFTYWDASSNRNVRYSNTDPIYVQSKTTRMVAEQNALSNLISQLLDKNDASGANEDIVELSVISFGDWRFDKKPWHDETEEGWTKGRDSSGLNGAVSSNRFTSGTNWEEAFQYAKEVISAKKEHDGDDEDYYVVFLTDGEPTAVEGNEANSAPYTGENGNLFAYNEAKDEAKWLVDNDIKFYNIFTYRTTEDEKYSIYLTNYAYGNGEQNNSTSTEAVKNYFADAKTPDDVVNALNNIFHTVEDSIGHGNVSITDTLTTDAMTTTVVQGKTNGYVYEVKDSTGKVLYTVTATGDLNSPSVTFNVPESIMKDYTATATTVGDKTVYSVTTAEGKVYKMALADVDDETGELVWDLSSVGILMNNCTYSVSFIVWPDQDAYDYVAGLNNGLTGYEWIDDSTINPKYEDLRSTKGYEKGGVERYPSIVKKSDGIFAVLTNTDQKIHYSVVETIADGDNIETTVNGPYYQDLQTPDPMPLTASKSQLEKIWNVDRNPAILAQLLYGGDEPYTVEFDILRDDNPETDEDDIANKYTNVTLGWDPTAAGGQGDYVWDPNSVIGNVEYNGHTYSVGTRWVKEFSIATGLALSTERMDALGLDKESYRSAQYGGKTYYILEVGHDYSIKELNPRYEFDFESPIYHPMLVDGVLMSVNVTKDAQGKITDITKMEPISVDEDGTSSLKVENNLRGYLHLNKVVVDQDGETPLSADDTKFEFVITLTDSKGRFSGADIPWYGINGLFYHDENFNYYQADPTTTGHLRLETEFDLDEDGENDVYDATCSGNFNPDIVGPTTVTYTDKSGKKVTIQLYGNQTTASEDHKTATATMTISQAEVLNIANIPEGSTYRIVEADKAGYEFVKIDWEIKDGDEVEEPTADTPTPTKEGTIINGTIISNRDNHVTYTNKCQVADISIQKLDGEGNGLPGAVFSLKKVGSDESGESGEKTESDVTGVAGIGDITKVIAGEEVVYSSAFESTGEIQTFRLPDGTYRLYEVYIPDGYICKFRYIEFIIADRKITKVKTDPDPLESGVIEATGVETSLLALTINNTPGAALPHTGGPGTRIFTILGMLLIAGAALLLWKRRRAI